MRLASILVKISFIEAEGQQTSDIVNFDITKHRPTKSYQKDEEHKDQLKD